MTFPNLINLIVPPVYAQFFGTIDNPTKYNSTSGSGLFSFLSNLFKTAGTIAAIFVVFQIISAGYLYISAAGDPKKFEQAWNKIWQALLGLIIVLSAFTIGAFTAKLTGIDPLHPTIYGP